MKERLEHMVTDALGNGLHMAWKGTIFYIWGSINYYIFYYCAFLISGYHSMDLYFVQEFTFTYGHIGGLLMLFPEKPKTKKPHAIIVNIFLAEGSIYTHLQ